MCCAGGVRRTLGLVVAAVVCVAGACSDGTGDASARLDPPVGAPAEGPPPTVPASAAPPPSTDPPAPAADPVTIERATAVRGLPRADPRAPAIIVTPGLSVPNPFVLPEDGTFHLYSSQIGWFDPNVEYRSSGTITAWPAGAEDALPHVPAWAVGGFTWAPDVRPIGDRYVMYMTTRQPEPEMQCIGAAVADRPEGPFEALDHQIVCQTERLGSIDPRSFVDENGALWLHWKSDDNADIEGTTTSSIYAQPLAPDGLSLVGEPVRILEVDQPWEGRIVEAPDMVLIEDQHWLFYSGNWFNQPAYAIGAARCDGPAGPCHKPFPVPLLASNDQGAGPGEQSLFVDDEGRLWMVYSPVAQQYTETTPRPVALARIGLDDVGPYLADPAVD